MSTIVSALRRICVAGMIGACVAAPPPAAAGGLRDVLTIVAKSWLSVQVALLLAYTTPFPDLIDALRALRLPGVMVGIIGFMYRYLAVLTDEAGRMLRARDARSAAPVAGRGGGVADHRRPVHPERLGRRDRGLLLGVVPIERRHLQGGFLLGRSRRFCWRLGRRCLSRRGVVAGRTRQRQCNHPICQHDPDLLVPIPVESDALYALA